MQWSFSNKGSSSQLLSFQEEKPQKSGFECLKSSGLVSITTKEAFDYVQKNIAPQKQGGAHYSGSTYPATHRAKHTIHHSISNPSSRAVTVSPILKPSFAGQQHIASVSPQNRPCATQQTNYVPSSSPRVGSTELRKGANISSPDLMTVFYNGSVCVFDNVSLEKAQAIMLLARNSPPTPCSPSSPPVAQAQASVHISPINLDDYEPSRPYNSARLSPLPIKSVSVSQSARRSSNNSRDTIIVPPVGILESSFSIAEPLRAVYPPRSIPSTSTPSGTVPQLRRKSLARFLERRQDRVVSASPYAEKQS